MIVDLIELENIRSYKHEVIKFQEGINLLSGDIGSGKSSILQALEFALLGFKRGDLEGIHLLRKGEEEGFVRVVLISDNNKIEILRRIKKGKNSISQENGFLQINNSSEELSPTELTAKIFEFANLPQEFITKDKNLLYRFTIYTVQEQLKEILFTKIDDRLETIRKLFNIDKYKKLKDAIEIYLKEIRDKLREYQVRLEPAQRVEEERETILEEKIILSEKKIKFENEYKIFKEKFSSFKEKFDKIKENREILNEKLRTCEKNILIIKNLEEKKEEILIEIKNLNKLDFTKENINLTQKEKKINEDIQQLMKEVQDLKDKVIKIEREVKLIADFKHRIDSLDKRINNLRVEIQTLENKKLELTNSIKDATKMEICPICFQEVSVDHKNKLEEHVKTQKEILNSKIETLKLSEKKLQDEKLSETKKREELELKEREILKIKTQINSKSFELDRLNLKLNEIKREVEDLGKKLDLKKSYEEKIKSIDSKIEMGSSIRDKKKIIDEKLASIKENLRDNESKVNSMIEKDREYVRELSILETKIEETQKKEKQIKDTLKVIEDIKMRQKKTLDLQKFLSEKVLQISDLIEKYVFTKYYIEFNEEFERIFRELIEDNEIEVRLNDEFVIVVEQNGYDIDIKNLSGGEKSSLALAYRLALKKIIEEALAEESFFKFLILDEPTDGFSSQQVDRLGLILKESQMKQIIVVSHDSKVESIADNVLRVSKTVHISSVS